MGRVLRTAVIAGGVLYPAGTAETKELAEKVTDPDRWDGAADQEPENGETGTAPKAKRRSGQRRSSEA